jgi:hypothetical protein
VLQHAHAQIQRRERRGLMHAGYLALSWASGCSTPNLDKAATPRTVAGVGGPEKPKNLATVRENLFEDFFFWVFGCCLTLIFFANTILQHFFSKNVFQKKI